MYPKDPKDFLWSNLLRLLGLKEDAGVDAVYARLDGSAVSRGTVQRIKQGSTSVGTDQLMKLATHLGIEIWQLLDTKHLHAPNVETIDARKVAAYLSRTLLDLEADQRQAVGQRLANLASFPDSALAQKDLVSALLGEMPVEAVQDKLKRQA